MKNDKVQKPKEKSTKQKKEEQREEVIGELAPPELVEAMKRVPSEVRERFFGMIQASGTELSPIHTLLKKFTTGHIDKFLDYSHKDDENNYKLQSTNRIFNLIYVLIIVLFVLFLVVFLARGNQDLLNDIIQILVGLAGGFGGGYGYRAYRERQK